MTKRFGIFLMVLGLMTREAAAQGLLGGVGGGGTGVLMQVLQWCLTNIVLPLAAFMIIFRGVGFFFGHHMVAQIAAGAVGLLIIANYQTLLGMFGLG